jgi:hypothetical protein
MKVNARSLSVNRHRLRVGSIDTNKMINDRGVNRIMAKANNMPKVINDASKVAVVGDGGVADKAKVQAENLAQTIKDSQLRFNKGKFDDELSKSNGALIDANTEFKKQLVDRARHIAALSGFGSLCIIDVVVTSIPLKSRNEPVREIIKVEFGVGTHEEHEVARWTIQGNPATLSREALENELLHVAGHHAVYTSAVRDKNENRISSVGKSTTGNYHNNYFKAVIENERVKNYASGTLKWDFIPLVELGYVGNKINEFSDITEKSERKQYGSIRVQLGDEVRDAHRKSFGNDLPEFVAGSNGIGADGVGRESLGNVENPEALTKTVTTYRIKCKGKDCNYHMNSNEKLPKVTLKTFNVFSDTVKELPLGKDSTLTEFEFGTDAKHPKHECGGRFYGEREKVLVTTSTEETEETK